MPTLMAMPTGKQITLNRKRRFMRGQRKISTRPSSECCVITATGNSGLHKRGRDLENKEHTCQWCGKKGPSELFNTANVCLDCKNKYDKEWRAANMDKVKSYRAKFSGKRQNDYMKKYYVKRKLERLGVISGQTEKEEH
jgi:hypothetical protein